MPLSPEQLGDLPQGLPPYHREFLRKIKDAIEIFTGVRRAQSDTGNPPESQVVTFADLDNLAGEFRHEGNVSDDASFPLPAVVNSGYGFIVVGADAERAQFSMNAAGTVTLMNGSANVVANADTNAKVCIGTAVANPCIIKNRLGSTKFILLKFWYN